MSADRLCVGVLGVGHWGPNVVRNLATHPRVRLKYVCDIEQNALSRLEHLKLEGCSLVTDPDLVINDPEVQAIAIETPASTHYALSRQALQAGKHVYCEKPLTIDPQEGRELCRLAEERDRKLLVGFTFLYNKGVHKLRELIQSGRLGDIYYICCTRTHLGLVRNDVDVVWDLVPHDISIINYVTGLTPTAVLASGVEPLGTGRMDAAFITLFYPGNIVGQIHVSWVDSNKQRLVRVIGSKARAEFDDLNNLEPIRIFEKGISMVKKVQPDFGDFRFLLRDGDIISPKIDMSEPLRDMIDSFVRAILDHETTISDGKRAVQITAIVEAIQRSLLTRRQEPVTLKG
ncbi:MAG: gfo/Idh/MocA family oxidoreductase [Desulfarculus sp.]|jgi:predicted dehydrogenase|nr:MAG: gfo/Idh/MocA family oxidoreductase [Desulfarculus sp.]